MQLRGPRALSESRLAKLLASLKKLDPGVRSASAEHRYFVEAAGELAAGEQRLLERLLDDGSPRPAPGSGRLYLVVPRLGTLSPWSSKASDIARNCGLGEGQADRTRDRVPYRRRQERCLRPRFTTG